MVEKYNGKKLAILGASYMAGIFLDKARSMGIKTYCFAWEEGAVAKSHADIFFPISVMERNQILRICTEQKIDGVMALTEAPISTCGYIANQLHINGNSIETSENITKKDWVRDRARKCVSLKQPASMVVNIDGLSTVNQWNVFPAIIKPVSGGGKRGVIVINQKDELKEGIDFAGACDNRHNGILIEEYIEKGMECSVETLSYKGNHQIIQITEKISSGPPHCVELGHHQPAAITEEQRTKVCQAITELLDAVCYCNGPAHTEIKIVGNDIYLIELNPRPGGDHIASTLTGLSTGYDYIGQSICVALGFEPDQYNLCKDAYSGVYFITKQTEFLKDTFERCEDKPWLYKKHVESDELTNLSHNDCMHTNYMIYYSNYRVDLINHKEERQ